MKSLKCLLAIFFLMLSSFVGTAHAQIHTTDLLNLAQQLKQVNPDDYAAILKEAEVIGNA